MVARARIEDDDFQLKVARDDIPPKRTSLDEMSAAGSFVRSESSLVDKTTKPVFSPPSAANEAAAEAARQMFCDDGICAAPTTTTTMSTPARAPGLTFFTLHNANTNTKKTTEP